MPTSRSLSSSSRDMNFSIETTQMSISEKVKAEGGRNRKVSSLALSQNQSAPAPARVSLVSTRASSSENGSHIKTEKEGSKKLNSSLKKPGPKTGIKNNPKQLKQEDKSSSDFGHPTKLTGPSDTDSNDGGEYCTCRGPDDHRMMVNCEGPCKDWYHCSCLGIDEEDAKELLDRYVCPKCSTEDLFTTYKPMCRYFNISGCRKVAQINLKPTPSMYCSEQHKRDFWMYITGKLRSGDTSNMGGILSRDEVASLANICNNRSDWQALGSEPKLDLKNPIDPNHPIGLDFVTPHEAERIGWIEQERLVFKKKIEVVQAQKKFLIMIHEYCKNMASNPNLEVKDFCGYDKRLAMNEAQFSRWRNTAEGRKALETGTIGPRTQETLSIGEAIPFPGEAIPEPITSVDEFQNLCLKPRKKCKHNGWRDIHGCDYQLIISNYEEHITKLKAEADEIIEEAELREATKDYHAHNVTIQHF